MAQFSCNSHKSLATGTSLFKLAYGQQPMTPHEILVKKSGGRCLAIYQFARSKQELLDETRTVRLKHNAE
ncbi:UNVERIFIED_CONTAM: hypothetical protein Sradi_6860100 [Sesamum radiatum]|uniref:Uncharacterized protein n=1 Tax=Sesamum radiatum TaxID=300843 RepID=A0AAW2JKT5_SESRA